MAMVLSSEWKLRLALDLCVDAVGGQRVADRGVLGCGVGLGCPTGVRSGGPCVG